MSMKPSAPAPIVFWNRKTGQEEIEKIYRDAIVRWLYGTYPGQFLADKILPKVWLSNLYGSYQSSSLSQHKISAFIRDFQIPIEEYEPGPFRSFNEFFIRKFKEGARPFVQTPQVMPAFAEARYLAYEKIRPDETFPVKGKFLSSRALLNNIDLARIFEGGPLLLARLCPVDYHRYHFPDSGEVLKTYSVHGGLHSVNPLALQYKGDIFATNERQVSILETRNFGKLAYIEVGAFCVGRIVQTHRLRKEFPLFQRGDEKGYFLFGGSTIIVLGEPGRWSPDQDLLDQTARGRETLVLLGDRVANSK
jgi:phosphatidylserine decarboxylase